MIDEKIARVKVLIQKREEIDAELSAIFGGAAAAKRGRPRKEQGSSISRGVSISVSEAEGSADRQPADNKTP